MSRYNRLRARYARQDQDDPDKYGVAALAARVLVGLIILVACVLSYLISLA